MIAMNYNTEFSAHVSVIYHSSKLQFTNALHHCKDSFDYDIFFISKFYHLGLQTSKKARLLILNLIRLGKTDQELMNVDVELLTNCKPGLKLASRENCGLFYICHQVRAYFFSILLFSVRYNNYFILCNLVIYFVYDMYVPKSSS